MNEITRSRLLSTLKVAEGRKPLMYTDTVGVRTIGYGHALDNGLPLSETSMEQILSDDLADAERRCQRLPWYDALGEVRQATIAELAFNVGLGGLVTFRKMIDALTTSDWETAATELLDSRWRTQVGPSRSARMAFQLRTGTWSHP